MQAQKLPSSPKYASTLRLQYCLRHSALKDLQSPRNRSLKQALLFLSHKFDLSSPNWEAFQWSDLMPFISEVSATLMTDVPRVVLLIPKAVGTFWDMRLDRTASSNSQPSHIKPSPYPVWSQTVRQTMEDAATRPNPERESSEKEYGIRTL